MFTRYGHSVCMSILSSFFCLFMNKNVLADPNLKGHSSFRIFWNVLNSENSVQKCHFDSSQNCKTGSYSNHSTAPTTGVVGIPLGCTYSVPVSIVSANFSSPSNGWKLSPMSSVSFWLRHSLASCMLLVMKLDQYIGSVPDAEIVYEGKKRC